MKENNYNINALYAYNREPGLEDPLYGRYHRARAEALETQESGAGREPDAGRIRQQAKIT
jgi:hypothetical protein